MKTSQILGSCLVLSVCASVYGQNRVEQTEQFQRRQEITGPTLKLEDGATAPELYGGENQDVGPQRILQLRPRRTYFDVLVDSQFLWSDNVTLAGADKTESTIFVNTVEAAFAPTGLTLDGREIQPRIGVRNQWYNYGLTPGGNDAFLGTLDFEAQSVFAETRYRVADEWYLLLGVEGQRLVDQFDYSDDFYQEIQPYIGAQWFRALGDNKAITAAYRGAYHFSDTESFLPGVGDVNDRTTHSLTLAYVHELMPKLVLQPFYRFQYTYFTGENRFSGDEQRSDFLHELGASLGYHFTRNISLRTFAGYQVKNVDDEKSSLPDYEKLDIGAGATFNIQF